MLGCYHKGLECEPRSYRGLLARVAHWRGDGHRSRPLTVEWSRSPRPRWGALPIDAPSALTHVFKNVHAEGWPLPHALILPRDLREMMLLDRLENPAMHPRADRDVADGQIVRSDKGLSTSAASSIPITPAVVATACPMAATSRRSPGTLYIWSAAGRSPAPRWSRSSPSTGRRRHGRGGPPAGGFPGHAWPPGGARWRSTPTGRSRRRRSSGSGRSGSAHDSRRPRTVHWTLIRVKTGAAGRDRYPLSQFRDHRLSNKSVEA